MAVFMREAHEAAADAEEEERVEGLEVQRLISGGVLGGSGMPCTCYVHEHVGEGEGEGEGKREGRSS